MASVVQKYGGSAVTSPEQIRKIAQRIIQSYNDCNDVVVVISARAGETNRLIEMAQEICPRQAGSQYDLLISAGEQVSIGLLALCISSLGYKVKTYLGWQVPIITDSLHTRASIEYIDPTKIRVDLNHGAIVLVAGFQGIDRSGTITTLGRGGGDTSAVALAHALGAEVCELYSDVDGIFTADPAICENARKINEISYDEMLELASQGARGVQIRAIEYAKKHNVTMHIRSAFTAERGTLVVKEHMPMEGVVVTGIVADKNEAKIAVLGVPDKPGSAAKILTGLADKDISVDMIVQNVGQDGLADITFSISKTDLDKAHQITAQIAKEVNAREVLADRNISKVSIVGLGMKNHAGVAARMFTALAYNNINIQMISTSEIKVSVAIEEKYTELAVRVLHEAFKVDQCSE
ncbi:MAG: aspartate kinase [Trichlorobacter sp.]|uniref:aspartate kinase n=1 Tax=Trichlorobacter sp. TaxID=2911007 RepID=UPI00256198AC|nr:aspartate kinase [Trichlorobacter sp.]MDK9717287.1 aspartate kinase [Trichlorobacter sp.]